MCRIMAQDIIWGKVVDENKNPLPYVSVVLQHVQDSSYVSGVTSDVEGVFRRIESMRYWYLISVMLPSVRLARRVMSERL